MQEGGRQHPPPFVILKDLVGVHQTVHFESVMRQIVEQISQSGGQRPVERAPVEQLTAHTERVITPAPVAVLHQVKMDDLQRARVILRFHHQEPALFVRKKDSGLDLLARQYQTPFHDDLFGGSQNEFVLFFDLRQIVRRKLPDVRDREDRLFLFRSRARPPLMEARMPEPLGTVGSRKAPGRDLAVRTWVLKMTLPGSFV